MIKKAVLASALMSLGTAATAGPSAGDWEVVFSHAGGNLVTDGDATELTAGLRAGYFHDSNNEFGFGADFRYEKTEVGSADSLNLAGFYRYNLVDPQATDWLYGGVELELLNVTDSDFSSEAVRPHLGQKWMLSEDVAFDVNGGAIIPLGESDDDTALDIRFGLGIFF